MVLSSNRSDDAFAWMATETTGGREGGRGMPVIDGRELSKVLDGWVAKLNLHMEAMHF